MKSTRTAITLGYNERLEFEKGVFEDITKEVTVKAEQQQVYQRRLDVAMVEGFKITARFLIRNFKAKGNLKYVKYKGKKFKVNQVNENVENHFTTIEIGELL